MIYQEHMGAKIYVLTWMQFSQYIEDRKQNVLFNFSMEFWEIMQMSWYHANWYDNYDL